MSTPPLCIFARSAPAARSATWLCWSTPALRHKCPVLQTINVECRMFNPPACPSCRLWMELISGGRASALARLTNPAAPRDRPRGQEEGGAAGPFCARFAARPRSGRKTGLQTHCFARAGARHLLRASNGYSPCVNFNSSMFAAANLLQPLQAHRAEVLALTCRMGPPAKQGCAGVDS
jgi:hypothetical protein